MPDLGPGDRVRGSAEVRASGPQGPLGEARRVSFEGVVTAVDGQSVLVRVGRTDVQCKLADVALLAKGSVPEQNDKGAPQNAAATLDKFLEDARRIGASMTQFKR